MNLSTQGDSDYVVTGNPDTYTPVSNGSITGTDGIAEQVNGLYKAVTDLQTLLGNALTLKGSVASLKDRLSLIVGPDGAFRKGTVFPGSPIDGEAFYRTDLDTVWVYDAASGQWKPGFDNILYALLDGTRDYTGDIKIKKALPALRLTGQEGGAADYQIMESAGIVTTRKNTGTEGAPVWVEDNFFIPTGAMLPYGGAIAPNGYSFCDGGELNRTTDARLFAVIGTTYGAGNGTTTFNKPDKRGRSSMGAGQGVGLTTRVLGTKLGEEQHTLVDAEVPAQTVTVRVDDENGSGGGGAVGIKRTALIGGETFSNAFPTITSEGGGGPHNTIHPVEVDNWIIKL